jgi:ADP-ribose pyrophosphatase YjhB (NUDIX family)
MNVLHVLNKIGLVSDLMLPEATLPDSFLLLALPGSWVEPDETPRNARDIAETASPKGSQ